MPTRDTQDSLVRSAAFDFLRRETELRGEVLPWSVLSHSFSYHGARVPLIGPQGIFKPAVLELPISITTAPIIEGKPRPYEDEIEAGGAILYRYRGTNPAHPDNVGLRRAMVTRTPLIYNFGVTVGHYLPVWPVFIVGDDPHALTFRVEADDPLYSSTVKEDTDIDVEQEARRRYVTVTTKRRLHQVTFRQRVLRAYRTTCAVCRLRHEELLDAAHILPDSHPRGAPIVPNGLSLCKLHHAAFDRNILGVHPDLHVEIRLDILREEDGPMLQHGLQGFQGTRISIPRATSLQPDRGFLEERFDIFQRA